MDLKKLKMQKCDHVNIDSNLNNQNLEVLVLPPEILQKLGINLENIPIPKDTTGCKKDNINEFKKSNPIIKPTKTNDASNESSIIETANLMKASVFLSPTFTTLKNNNNLVEPDISFANVIENAVEKNQDSSFFGTEISDKTVYQILTSDKNETNLNECRSDKNVNGESFESTTGEKNHKSTKLSLKNKIKILSETILNSPKINTSINEVASSVTSEICSGNTISNTVMNLDQQNITNNMHKPESIIVLEKETLTTGKMQAVADIEFKVSELSTKKILNMYKNSTKQSLGMDIYLLNETTNNNNLILKNNSNVETENLHNKSDDIHNSAHKKIVEVNHDENSTKLGNHKLDIKENLQSDIINSDLINNDPNIPRKSVHNINNETPNNFMNKIKEDNNYKIHKDVIYQVNNNGIKPKLCVQGVEKPGGKSTKDNVEKEQIVQTLKTYSRKGKHLSSESNKIITNVKNIVEGNNINMANELVVADNISNIEHNQKFCICKDFGYLAYYESDESYQHIHYWNSKHSECTLNNLISIYSDDKGKEDEFELYGMLNIENKENNLESILDNSYTDSRICWQDIDHEEHIKVDSDSFPNNQNKEHIKLTCSNKDTIKLELSSEVVLGEINHMVKCTAANDKEKNFTKNYSNTRNTDKIFKDDITSVPDNSNNNLLKHLTEKEKNGPSETTNNKRKRSSSNSDGELFHQNTIKKVTKIVECGVCNTELADTEWEEHKDKKHCYIAWINGQQFNFQDKNLISKIRSKIEEFGNINCSLCDIEFNRANKFLKHFEQCINQSGTNKSDAKLSMSLNKTFDSEDSDVDDEIPISELKNRENIVVIEVCDTKRVECGVCQEYVDENLWIDHIGKKHFYVAWKSKEKALDESDEESIRKYLNDLCKQIGGLKCYKCGLIRKMVKLYLKHIKVCDTEEPKEPFQTQIESEESIVEEDSIVEEESDVNVQCGVCSDKVLRNDWLVHISTKHNYIAWKTGEPKLDLQDEDGIHDYLHVLWKEVKSFICAKCGICRKYPKAYLKHIKTCRESQFESNNDSVNDSCMSEISQLNTTSDETKICDTIVEETNLSKFDLDYDESGMVVCGVCQTVVEAKLWIEHIQKQHAYLAWKEGKKPLDLQDEDGINDYLHVLWKKVKSFICAKCGICRKYPKAYLKHIKICSGSQLGSNNDSVNDSCISEISHLNTTADETEMCDTTVEESILSKFDLDDDESGMVVCGVCQTEVEAKFWIEHIQKQHAYLAWKEGKKPLDLGDGELIKEYLNAVNKKINGIVCNKCGLVRKYVKSYLSHYQYCRGDNSLDITDALQDKDSFECAVCSEVGPVKEWKLHAMEKHYNIAWPVGAPPFDVKNGTVIENLLKEYKKKYKKLECSKCNITRVSYAGFFAHVIQCGKTEKEIDVYRDVCTICNNKYISIYKNQHYGMHREQEFIKQRKIAKLEKEKETSVPIDTSSDRRRAAQKARHIIGKFESYEFRCDTCGFGADDELEVNEHVCRKRIKREQSDFENSEQGESEEESDDDGEVQSDASNDEGDTTITSKSVSTVSKINKMPFPIKNVKAYIYESAQDFFKTFYTSDILYPNWNVSKYEIVPDEALSCYMPTVQESCKVIIGKSDWMTLKQLEARGGYEVTLFTGANIQCISWAPPLMDGDCSQFLCVGCHNSPDSPRIDAQDLVHYPNMLQIWDFGDFDNEVPKFVLGIAHDYGAVWSMAWCPSGARDVFPESESHTPLRLGLLAIACSNGAVYILSVPYPSTILKDRESVVCKLTPVAQLRLCHGKRQKFQATVVDWSPERGHSTIMVGYADGVTAFYDLECTSPLLTDVEDGIKILYPYHDERSHSTCITGAACAASAWGARAACSAAAGGAELAAGPGRTRVALPAAAAAFAPHCSSALLPGNDALVNQAVNEIDVWGMGRRLGPLHSCCGCLHCGKLAMMSPPVLKLVDCHPGIKELKKESKAIIQMKSISKTRTKHKNDQLAVKVEPDSYEEAVKVYGLEFKLVKDVPKETLNKLNKPNVQCPERFPLSDIPSMAFCPSSRHHRRLAAATHSGVIFVFNT